jgi:hypothetical protein
MIVVTLVARWVRAVLACGVLLAKSVQQPTALMYERKASWGGFLQQNARSANDLSINDIQLLKIAEKDIKKQHKAAVKTEVKVSPPLVTMLL